MVVRIRMGFLGLCGLVVVSGKMCDANRRLQYAGRFRVVLSLVAAEGSVAVVSADTIVGVAHSCPSGLRWRSVGGGTERSDSSNAVVALSSAVTFDTGADCREGLLNQDCSCMPRPSYVVMFGWMRLTLFVYRYQQT